MDQGFIRDLLRTGLGYEVNCFFFNEQHKVFSVIRAKWSHCSLFVDNMRFCRFYYSLWWPALFGLLFCILWSMTCIFFFGGWGAFFWLITCVFLIDNLHFLSDNLHFSRFWLAFFWIGHLPFLIDNMHFCGLKLVFFWTTKFIFVANFIHI